MTRSTSETPDPMTWISDFGSLAANGVIAPYPGLAAGPCAPPFLVSKEPLYGPTSAVLGGRRARNSISDPRCLEMTTRRIILTVNNPDYSG